MRIKPKTIGVFILYITIIGVYLGFDNQNVSPDGSKILNIFR
jgi:hypothetical protein